MITQEYLKERFKYKNGSLFWRTHRWKRRIGQKVGHIDKLGYTITRLGDRNYKVHRLIFMFHHGYFPEVIDHINNKKSDNRIENLRAATWQENSRNRNPIKDKKYTSYKGVTWSSNAKKWQVGICVNGVLKNLGYFSNKKEAAKTYDKHAKKLFGEFAKTNFE